MVRFSAMVGPKRLFETRFIVQVTASIASLKVKDILMKLTLRLGKFVVSIVSL